jgi:hypothetical protein
LLWAQPVRAQVSVLGKGFSLDVVGSLTSSPGEVISGGTSIKGSYSGPNEFTSILITDPTFIRLEPNQTYTITLSYRILAQGSRGFSVGFFSPAGSREGRFVPTTDFSGGSGTSGTATLTARLASYPDYGLGVKVIGSGSIVIDDIRITNSAGQLVASENAEGPTIDPGPLNFQLTDAIALRPDANATVRSAAAKDLGGDGYPETILTLTAPRPSTTPLAPIVIESRSRMRLATTEFFPAGAPTVKHSPGTFFADVNSDGQDDIVFADGGSDAPPWAGSGVGVGLSVGGGKYRNVSSLVPTDLQSVRSYSLAVGDIDATAVSRSCCPTRTVAPTQRCCAGPATVSTPSATGFRPMCGDFQETCISRIGSSSRTWTATAGRTFSRPATRTCPTFVCCSGPKAVTRRQD